MAKNDMEYITARLNQWECIVDTQLNSLQQQFSEELFDKIQNLELEKRVIMLELLEQNLLVKSYDSEIEHIKATLTRLHAINKQLEQGIQVWYVQVTKNMKQLSDQKLIQNSYTDTQTSDVISYYFDKKK